MYDIDPRQMRDTCGSFATGVTVISTRTAQGDHGMTANAFMSVSLDPPLIAISLGHDSRMREKIRQSGRFAVNILSRDMEPVAMHFAGRHDPAFDSIFAARDGLPVLPGSVAVLLADVDSEVEAGDHTVVIGRVTALERDDTLAPLLFSCGQFRSLAEAV